MHFPSATHGPLRATLAAFWAAALAGAPFLDAAAQQGGHYEFVPGSRQAKWVPGPAPVAGQQMQRQYQVVGAPVPTQPRVQQAAPSRAGSRRGADYSDSVTVDGQTRTYVIHVPPGYDGKRTLPVVMAFHGLGMNATMMYALTGFTGLADRQGFIVVFPNAAGGRWQDGLSNGRDDVSFVQAMLAKLERTVSVDTRRVYACGISNGGYFSQLLALAMPERIAAAGVVAATLTRGGAAQAGGKSVPIAFFLGTDDPLLPWGDGRNKELGKLGEVLGISSLGSIDGAAAKIGGLCTVPETIAFWTAHNGAGGTPYVSQMPDRAPNDGTRVQKETYGSSSSQVVLYRITGGGHTWPGSIDLKAMRDVSGNTSQDIDASELLWDFFKPLSR